MNTLVHFHGAINEGEHLPMADADLVPPFITGWFSCTHELCELECTQTQDCESVEGFQFPKG